MLKVVPERRGAYPTPRRRIERAARGGVGKWITHSQDLTCKANGSICRTPMWKA